MSNPSLNTAPPRPIPDWLSVCGWICRRSIVNDSSGGFVTCSNASWSQASPHTRRMEMNATTALLSKSGLPALEEMRAEKLHAWHRERLAVVYVRQSTAKPRP